MPKAAVGNKAASGPKELVGESVVVYCTDGNRINKDTTFFGELEAFTEHGIRLKYQAHGSTIHSFIPYSNMISIEQKEKKAGAEEAAGE